MILQTLAHNVATKFKESIVEITGASTSITAVLTKYSQETAHGGGLKILENLAETALLAGVSGFVGGLVAHFTKKLINKIEQLNKKK